jgi:hypothetical protein
VEAVLLGQSHVVTLVRERHLMTSSQLGRQSGLGREVQPKLDTYGSLMTDRPTEVKTDKRLTGVAAPLGVSSTVRSSDDWIVKSSHPKTASNSSAGVLLIMRSDLANSQSTSSRSWHVIIIVIIIIIMIFVIVIVITIL